MMLDYEFLIQCLTKRIRCYRSIKLVLGAARLSSLYGVAFEDPNLLILMRHRAVLFGLLGMFLIYAAFHSSLHLISLIAGFANAASFVAIAVSVGGYNEAINCVVIADVMVVVLLVIATLLHFMKPEGRLL